MAVGGGGGGHRGTRGGVRGPAGGGTRGADQAQGGNTEQGRMFHKPRALSRQHDANIRIEVHRDETIINHLQREQKANMNLMFYDFNGSSL